MFLHFCPNNASQKNNYLAGPGPAAEVTHFLYYTKLITFWVSCFSTTLWVAYINCINGVFALKNFTWLPG